MHVLSFKDYTSQFKIICDTKIYFINKLQYNGWSVSFSRDAMVFQAEVAAIHHFVREVAKRTDPVVSISSTSVDSNNKLIWDA